MQLACSHYAHPSCYQHETSDDKLDGMIPLQGFLCQACRLLTVSPRVRRRLALVSGVTTWSHQQLLQALLDVQLSDKEGTDQMRLLFQAETCRREERLREILMTVPLSPAGGCIGGAYNTGATAIAVRRADVSQQCQSRQDSVTDLMIRFQHQVTRLKQKIVVRSLYQLPELQSCLDSAVKRYREDMRSAMGQNASMSRQEAEQVHRQLLQESLIDWSFAQFLLTDPLAYLLEDCWSWWQQENVRRDQEMKHARDKRLDQLMDKVSAVYQLEMAAVMEVEKKQMPADWRKRLSQHHDVTMKRVKGLIDQHEDLRALEHDAHADDDDPAPLIWRLQLRRKLSAQFKQLQTIFQSWCNEAQWSSMTLMHVRHMMIPHFLATYGAMVHAELSSGRIVRLSHMHALHAAVSGHVVSLFLSHPLLLSCSPRVRQAYAHELAVAVDQEYQRRLPFMLPSSQSLFFY